MLYFKVLLEGIAELPPGDAAIRQQILSDAEQLGWQAMHQRLAEVDPITAAALHPNHSQRIQRALEVYYSSGETLSSHQARRQRLLLIALRSWLCGRRSAASFTPASHSVSTRC